MRTCIRGIASAAFACVLLAQQPVAQQIEQLPSADAGDTLGAKLLKDARANGAAAAASWKSTDPATRKKARATLNAMEEAALDPLLHSNGPLEPEEQAWRMTMVVETLGDLRKAAASMLDRQLANKQAVPRPSAGLAEEREPASRVCDEAYMSMSRLAASDPKSQAFVLRMRQFLRMTPAARDAEIQRARQSAEWKGLLR